MNKKIIFLVGILIAFYGNFSCYLHCMEDTQSSILPIKPSIIEDAVLSEQKDEFLDLVSAEGLFELAMHNLKKCFFVEVDGCQDLLYKALLCLKKSAEKGYVPAQVELDWYERRNVFNGKPFSQQAIQWMLSTALKGDAIAQYIVAIFYSGGIYLEKDYAQAFIFIEKAAHQGLVRAQECLACDYYSGNFFERDLVKAVYWFRQAADLGSVYAQALLGYCYYTGTGIEQDLVKALYWINQAVNLGSSDAQALLGYCYYFGSGVDQDIDKAVSLWKIANEDGSLCAKHNLANCYYLGSGVDQDIELALSYWEDLTYDGYAEAWDSLIAHYFDCDMSEDDFDQAMDWLIGMAYSNNYFAQYMMGFCYEHGIGVDQDFKQAVDWYRQIAEKGCMEASIILAICYDRGIGVAQNKEAAAALMNKEFRTNTYIKQFFIDSKEKIYGTKNEIAQAITYFNTMLIRYSNFPKLFSNALETNTETTIDALNGPSYWYNQIAKKGLDEAQQDFNLIK